MLHSFHRFSRLEVAQPVEAVAQVELGSCGVPVDSQFFACG